MHLHGNTWVVTGTEGGRVPEAAWTPGNTEIVGVAQARTMEFEAKYPGDWMLHCHLPHHMMNQMVSMVVPLSHLGHGMHTGMSMKTAWGCFETVTPWPKTLDLRSAEISERAPRRERAVS